MKKMMILVMAMGLLCVSAVATAQTSPSLSVEPIGATVHVGGTITMTVDVTLTPDTEDFVLERDISGPGAFTVGALVYVGEVDTNTYRFTFTITLPATGEYSGKVTLKIPGTADIEEPFVILVTNH
jgi:hypothetical protein